MVASVDELWDAVDLVVVATPNRTHVPLALAALERGLPVVVDKPIAPSTAEAERLLAAGGRVTVFQNRRLDGDFLTVRRLMREGVLGEPTRLESRFERFRPDVSAGAWRELPDPAEGGGLLLDLGAHLVDQARELFGPPARVYAEVDARRPGARVEDDVFLALEHPGEVRSHLWMSAIAPLHGPRLRASGLRAGIETFGLDPQEAQLADGVRPDDDAYGRGGAARLVDAAGARDVQLERGAYPASTRELCDGCATARRRRSTLSTAWPDCRCLRRLARAPRPAPSSSSTSVLDYPWTRSRLRPSLTRPRPSGARADCPRGPESSVRMRSTRPSTRGPRRCTPPRELARRRCARQPSFAASRSGRRRPPSSQR